MRGRKPHPTAVKLLRNNPGRRPLNLHEPKHPAIDPATPPAFLADNPVARAARAEWERVIEGLSHGHVSTVDRPTLIAYCLKFGQWQTYEAEAARGEYVTTTLSGRLTANPMIGLANKTLTLMLRAAAELGLTPSSRSRVVLTAEAETRVDEFTAFQHKRRPGA